MKLAPHFCFLLFLRSPRTLSTICMAVFNFTKSFFFPKGEDGNISFSTIQQRIEQAMLNIKTPEDYIELEDGTKCFSREELERAILSETNKKVKTGSSQKKKLNANTIVALIVSIAFLLLFFFSFFTGKYAQSVLIASAIGIIFPIYLLTKKETHKEWKASLILFVISSFMFILSIFGDFDYIVGDVIIQGTANLLLLIGFLILFSKHKNTIFAIPCLLMVIPCIYYIAYVSLCAWSEDREFIHSAFNYQRWDMLSIKYILLSISTFFYAFQKKFNIFNHEIKPSLPWIALVVSLLLVFVWGVKEVNDYEDYLEYQEKIESMPKYMDVVKAYEQGLIGYGSTYEEIKAICGPAEDVSKVNGRVQIVTYKHHSVHIWFDEYGGLNRFSEN